MKAAAGRSDKDAAEEKRIDFDILKDMAKDNLRLCMKRGNKTGTIACLRKLANMTKGVEDNGVIKNISSRLKLARRVRFTREASLDLVGSEHWQCLKAAMQEKVNKSEHVKKCATKLVEKSDMAGLMNNLPNLEKYTNFTRKLPGRIKTRYAAKMVKDAARACNKTARFACLRTAKDKLKEVGMNVLKFRGLKKLADVRGAAETWVSCMEASDTEADIQKDPEDVCEKLAKEALEDLSGSDDIWQDYRERVLKLGKTLLNGTETLIEKFPALDFDAASDAEQCSSSTLSQIQGELLTWAKQLNPKLSKLTPAKCVPRCRQIFGKANYQVKLPTEGLNETEIEVLAEGLAENMKGSDYKSGTQNGGRRLQEVIVEAYAAQASSEVPAAEADQAPNATTQSNSTTESPDSCVPFHLKVQNPVEGCQECFSYPCSTWIPCSGAVYPICTSAK